MPELMFASNTTTFDLRNAYSLALAAELAYKDADEIKDTVTVGWSYRDFKFLDSTEGTQGFIASDNENIVVVFRGTEPDRIEDWLTDLNFDLMNGPLDGKVHQGFYTALNTVWQQVERTISRFRANKPKSLWFGGHSLGAALATLAVARLRDQDLPVDGLYTFGQPRTGDRTFARNLNLDFKPYAFRFVNNNDIVTRAPPRGLKYSHIGTFKYFTESGELKGDISFWNRFLDRMRGRAEDIFEWGSDGIKDHNMAEYRSLIEKALRDEA